MARPAKHAGERRRNRTIRYTEAEWQRLGEAGAAAGLSTSEYARNASLEGRIVVRKAARGVDPALIGEVNRLALQLAALGNLANQVARYAHTGRRLPPDWVALPTSIRRTQDEVATLLEKLVGAA